MTPASSARFYSLVSPLVWLGLGNRLMKNPHPDKNFFQFLEKILNGQAEDLSLSGSADWFVAGIGPSA
jgi:hypothetical protein